MYLISHRGNITGRQPERENAPDYILEAIDAGYYCEVDILGKVDGSLWLGHDGPQYKTDTKFLNNPKILCHCKNKLAIDNLNGWGIHWFWHQNDDYTITSKGFIWTYPGNVLSPSSICVMPEVVPGIYNKSQLLECAGICSDYIGEYR